MPQYRYALTEQGHVIDALQLPADRDEHPGPFQCMGCGRPLVAKAKGEKREKHFSHRAQAACSPETYLHRLAKQAFFDTYRACLEHGEAYCVTLSHPRTCDRFEHLLGRRCSLGRVERTYDLTAYYDSIRMEARDGNFIPDLLLADAAGRNGAVYVEIAVTHFLSGEKERSSHRIVEIPVEREEDLGRITGRHVTEREARFVNFPRQAVPVADAECVCTRETYHCLMIYSSGKSFLESGTLPELEGKGHRLGETLRYARLRHLPQYDLQPKWEIFQELLQDAAARGFAVRNCLLCRYGGASYNSLARSPVYCKFKKKGCASNDAVECEAFRLPRPVCAAAGTPARSVSPEK